jgi:excisionase family DNA binding protein
MASRSLESPRWLCVPCALLGGVEYVDPASPTDTCAECRAPASPCAVLRRELGELRDELRARRSSETVTPAVPAAGTVLEEPPMTAKQVAAYLQMTVPAVYMAAKRCQLPFHRVGNSRSIRFFKTEIDAELARR